MRITVKTFRLLTTCGGPALCGLLLMSCADAPPDFRADPVSEQAGTPRLELGKEYPLPDEAAHIKEISDLFTGMSERKYPPGVRPMRRDAHTKAHGCVKAELTVPPQVPERARVGLFKAASTHPAWIRYSNAFSSIDSDGKIDVRGMAIKVMGVEGEKLLEAEKLEQTQDFLLINTNVFFSPNTSEYVKFSREYESQADILGVQLMARAGYNPQSMANMFRTLASQGGGGPEWLSDHPNPGNREQRILQESKLLNATGNPSGNTPEFQRAQARLKGMSPALTAKEIQQQTQRRQPTGTSGRAVNVAPPSGSYRTYQPSNGMRVAVPANWDPVQSAGNAVTYAPQGAYFSGDNGGSAFTHGVEVGVAQGTGDLQRDTNSLLRNFAQSNPDLQQSGRARNESVAGRSGITVDLANVSEVTGQAEYISLSTTELRNGGLLYVIGVAPRTEAGTYQDAFRRIRQNIQVADR